MELSSLMIINNSRNKLQQVESLNNSNEILIKRLDNLKIQTNLVSFNKQQQEIILVDNQYISTTYLNYSYQFSNLEEQHLSFLTPYVLISSTYGEGFNSVNYSPPTYSIWKKIGTNYIFEIWLFSIAGLIELSYDSQNHTYTYAPIYLTIKIKVFNNNLFKSFQTLK